MTCPDISHGLQHGWVDKPATQAWTQITNSEDSELALPGTGRAQSPSGPGCWTPVHLLPVPLCDHRLLLQSAWCWQTSRPRR